MLFWLTSDPWSPRSHWAMAPWSLSQMIKWFSHAAWPQLWSQGTGLSSSQARRGRGEVLLDIYTDIQSSSWQHRRFFILHTQMPRQTCSCMAGVHPCGHGDQQTPQQLLFSPRLSCPGTTMCSLWASFSFPTKVRPFFPLFFYFPLGIWFLNGNSPNCLPVVVGNGKQWFRLKCHQMRCGGVNPDIFPLL